MSPLEAQVADFRARVLLDALAEGTASYWLRRAAAFEDAKPRPDDFNGAATDEMLSARWRRMDQIARACRRAADIAVTGDRETARGMVLRALREVEALEAVAA
ncbi:hypothetical protein [Nocardioides bruguierae]|uniref:Uncharacterized protein n=1 Tax=Nocardioides bruguierae TaxID=2945102 RepID=A0A9X2IDX4_9ACTN|nr:hypothetical protein [Nocardioides bruguierae]MCM0618744.1 hypothetical protein [Nocardioides bruguierae]